MAVTHSALINVYRIPSIMVGGDLNEMRRTQYAKNPEKYRELLIGKMHDLLIVLDEPTASLYPAETDFIVDMIDKMRKKNTLLVVEHNEKVIERADQIIYLGHDGGKNGGYLISENEYRISQEGSLEYKYFKGEFTDKCILLSDHIDYAGSELEIHHSSITGICGMSGCGKTTVLRENLPKNYEDYLYVS